MPDIEFLGPIIVRNSGFRVSLVDFTISNGKEGLAGRRIILIRSHTGTAIQAESYPLYRRRANSMTKIIGSTEIGNRHVVPYNPGLLLKYNCHINVEITVGISAIK